jgi:hypothetical protein
MIYKESLYSKIKSHLQNTLPYLTDNTGGNLLKEDYTRSHHFFDNCISKKKNPLDFPGLFPNSEEFSTKIHKNYTIKPETHDCGIKADGSRMSLESC